MKRLPYRFFLSICILLLSGYCLLSAGTPKQSPFYSTLDNIQGSAGTSFDAMQNAGTFQFVPSTFGTRNKDFIIFVEENEAGEDKLTPAKKYVEIGTYFTSFFYARTPEHFFHYAKNNLSFRKHFAYLSSLGSSHILLCDIRI